jgi:hypothetical protein
MFLHVNFQTMRSWAPLERPPFVHPLNYSPAFYVTRRFIATFTRALHLYLSSARAIQSSSHHISKGSILILLTHLRLGLLSGLFPSGFPTSNLQEFLLFPIRATFLAHLTLLDLIIPSILVEQYKLCRSSLCSLLHAHVTSSYNH